jgi:hypothetical protein
VAYSLVELSRTRSVTRSYVVTHDYTRQPTLCRSGLWVGLKSEFAESVVLAYEHEPDPLMVGWSINGTLVVDPGFSAGTPPWGSPAPGVPGVTYTCPFGGEYHQLALTGTAGMDSQCASITVLYRFLNEQFAPFHTGPSLTVCLDGSSIAWPPDKVKAANECLARFRDIIRKYVQIAHVGPGDPVERWLQETVGDDVVKVQALVETLEQLDRQADGPLFEAVRAELNALMKWAASPGSTALRRSLDG